MSKFSKEDKKRYHSNNEKKIKISTNNKKIKILKKKETKKWTSEEDKLLTNLVSFHNITNFAKISKRIPGHTTSQCRLRWNKIKKGLKRGQWSIYEDKLLKEWVQKIGPKKWELCGKFITGRTGKQCREHWSNCLNPELIKGEWTTEEDFLIMYFYEKCKGSWKKIIHLFNGRTENSIKNRFFSQLRKIATKDMTIEERKLASKIKLEELKKFLNEALLDAKTKYLKEYPMSEEQLNDFIKKMKLKMKQKMSEEKNEYYNKINNNQNKEINILNNENKEKTFIAKRKRSTDELLDNSTENEDEKNVLIQNFEEKPNDNNISNKNIISIDENKDIIICNNLIGNESSTNEFNISQDDCYKTFNIDNSNNNSNNINNVYNINQDDEDNNSHSSINDTDFGYINNFNILANLDYQYKPSYKFLENCGLYRADSLGNILIDEKYQLNFNNQKCNDYNDIKEFSNCEKNTFYEN